MNGEQHESSRTAATHGLFGDLFGDGENELLALKRRFALVFRHVADEEEPAADAVGVPGGIGHLPADRVHPVDVASRVDEQAATRAGGVELRESAGDIRAIAVTLRTIGNEDQVCRATGTPFYLARV